MPTEQGGKLHKVDVKERGVACADLCILDSGTICSSTTPLPDPTSLLTVVSCLYSVQTLCTGSETGCVTVNLSPRLSCPTIMKGIEQNKKKIIKKRNKKK